MKNKLFQVLFVMLVTASLLLAACAPAAPVTPAATPQTIVQTVEVTKEVVQTQVVQVTPTPGQDPEAMIAGVEPNAEITLWTFWLSPTFDAYIKDTIASFQKAYPGVTVKWEDHQATFQDDLKNAYAAGNAPDVINLSISEGWVGDYATQGLLLPLDDQVPAAVKSTYFPNLWDQQVVQGKHYQFPWYQGIQVDLVNRQLFDQTGLKVADFPKTIDGLPALCKTIKEKTKTLCDIRLAVNDLLAQMDWVIASPHAALTQQPDQATQRLIRAIANPHVHLIGHPTGRMIPARRGLEPDMRKIIFAAARNGVALELNANSFRLDLRDSHLRLAREA